MLDVRRLRVLSAVVRTGSITAAARELNYSPSAISQALAVLERETNTALVEKVGRGIRPTPGGLLLARHAETIAAQIHRAQADLEDLRTGKTGRLRMAAFTTAGASLVPRAIARFKDDYPDVEVDLSIAETADALSALRDGDIDLALVGEHADIGDSTGGLEYEHLLADPYRLLLPRGHSLARKRSVPLEDLRDAAWISTASARCNCLETVLGACAQAGFSPRFAVEADEFATTIGFVAAGLGVAMVPVLALDAVPDSVRITKMREHEPKRFVYTVTRPIGLGNDIVRAMQEALHSSAEVHLRSAA